MNKICLVILIHQLIFQAMFGIKNTILMKKTGKQIRGNNAEANIFVLFFVLFMTATFVFSFQIVQFGHVKFLNSFHSTLAGLVLLGLNLAISTASLIDLKDSWRAGQPLFSGEFYLVMVMAQNPALINYF